MSQQSQNHHYVPIWYQERFLAPGATAFRVLDLLRQKFMLPDGSIRYSREILDKGPKAAFKTKNLYTVRLLGERNDDIERLLFGGIDTRGARAIPAFVDQDWRTVHDTYNYLYEFMDALRLRTPKGLYFVRAFVQALGARADDKMQLLYWMQRLRTMHCVMWAEGVLEILSAKDSPTKFIFSDHPVTLFNRYVFPGDPRIPPGFDPRQEWLGTQTLFPFDQENLFVMTHLEWARSPGPAKARKDRTNARYFDTPMIRYDQCLRDRSLTEKQVLEVNYIIKSRAHQYVAGRTDEDLFPERRLKSTLWSNLGKFLTPKDKLYQFGGEMFAGFEDGSFYFQDEFGRRPKTKAEYNAKVKEAQDARAMLDKLLAKEREKKQTEGD